MSIFGSIMEKIFHHPAATSAPAAASAVAPDSIPASTAPAAVPSPTAPSAVAPDSIPAATAPASVPPSAPSAAVDVGAVLTAMADQKGGGGNYQTSIVDLLKLLDLDASLDARKHLAQEIDVHAGADGSAEQNIALHKAVVQKLADNGGKVPESMKG